MNEKFGGDETYFAPDEPVSSGISSGQPSDDIEEEKTNEQKIDEIKNELFDRETPAEYQQLIEGVNFIRLHTEYSENLIDEFKDENSKDRLNDVGRYIANEIKDGIVLDLGCGQSNKINGFSEENGASLYIGVDLVPYIFFEKSYPGSAPPIPPLESEIVINTEPSEVQKNESAFEQPKFYLEDNALQIKSDMLETISRMKSRSVKLIIMSGIETKGGDTTREYTSVLKKEIKRVLKEDGLLLNYHSDISLPDSEPVEIDGHLEGIDIRRNRESEVLEASEN